MDEKDIEEVCHNENVLSTQLGEEHIATHHRQLLRKIDWRLLPLCAFIYLLNYLDRSNIGNARILNAETGDSLEQQTGLTDVGYSITLTAFAIAYSLFDVPANWVLKRYARPSYWLGSLMLCWGAVTVGFARVDNVATVMVLRVLIGVFEAGFFPGMVYLITFWYRQEERSIRIAFILATSTLAGAFGGCIAYGVGFMNGAGGLQGFRWLFIIEGAVTLLVAPLVVFALPNYPSTAKWLTLSEQRFAAERLEGDGGVPTRDRSSRQEIMETVCSLRMVLHYLANMRNITANPSLESLAGKTAILTGAAGGIGTAIAILLLSHGANVVLADLAHTRASVESMISTLPETQRSHTLFIPTNIVDWSETTSLFRASRNRFGRIDLVVANAGIMETTPVLDELDTVDEEGNLVDHSEFSTVIDVNVKGTMNCLRQALFYMRQNEPCPSPSSSSFSRGSVVLVSSISGYFGGTGVAGYVTSKHAVTGMLRASQLAAHRLGIRVNAVAPFVTPTAMSASFSRAWSERGLPINTTAGVAEAVLGIAVDPRMSGGCYMAVGHILREVEHAQRDVLADWLGEDLAKVFVEAAAFFESQGGYQLPEKRGVA